MSTPNMYVWPDGTWCWANEFEARLRDGASDDVIGIELPEWADEYDCESIAVAVNRTPTTKPAQIVSEFFGL